MTRQPGEWGVIGHEDAVSQLRRSLESGRVGHAYLITGPEGTGRTTLALAFARALNCLAPENGRPCNACNSCRRIVRDAERRSHPDLTLADIDWQTAVLGGRPSDRTRARQRLSIEAIRWLRQDIVTRPIMSRWKIQIVDDADELSESAPDAFLKTLEEPPASAVIVLVASSPDAVPETIRSRCHHLPLGLVPQATIEAALVVRGADPHQAASIAAIARGRVAAALRLASDPEAMLAWKSRVNDALEHVTDPLGRLRLAGPVAGNHVRDRKRTFELLDTCAGLWRDALLLRVGVRERLAHPDVAPQLEVYASRFEPAELLRALKATRRAIGDLERNFQARIALSAMIAQWPQVDA
jgi:DNA polymerase-3 subunit delta'